MATRAILTRVIDRVVAGFRLAARFDMGHLRLIVPIRLAVGVTIPLVIGQLIGNIGIGAAAAIGAFICGVADTGEALPIRVRVMSITALALGGAALLGGWISDSDLVVVLVAIPVAAACAFVGAFGANAAMTGMLTLVIFTIYAGNAIAVAGAVEQAVAVFLGCLLQVFLALAGWPFHRLPGIRGQVADAWRSLSVLADGDPADIFDPDLPATLVHAAASVGASGAEGVTNDWLTSLVSSTEAIRLPIAAVCARRAEIALSQGEESDEYRDLSDFVTATSQFCRGVARALVWVPRKRALGRLCAQVERTGQSARRWLPDQVELVTREVHTTNAALQTPWPMGRRCQLRYRISWGVEHLWPDAVANLTMSSLILRHTLRLSAAIPVAWIVGLVALPAHQYWVPMTLAWVAKPGYGVTVGRVFARSVGTLVGLVLMAALGLAIGDSVGWLVAACALSSYILFSLLPVNYAAAIVFVTTLVMCLFILAGEFWAGTLAERAVGTVLGAMIAVIFSEIGKSRAGPQLAEKLAVVAERTRGYCDAVATGSDLQPRTARLINARRAAASAIEESRIEGGESSIDPDRASHVLNSILLCIFFIAAKEQHRRTSQEPVRIDISTIDADLDRISHRLREVGTGIYSFNEPLRPTDITIDTDLTSAPAATQRCLRYLEVT